LQTLLEPTFAAMEETMQTCNTMSKERSLIITWKKF